MEEKELYTKKIDEYIVASGLDVPSDLIPWSYRWRCYIYSNVLPAVFGDRLITPEEIKLTKYLTKRIRDEHACNWVREKLYPINATGCPPVQVVGPNYKQLIISLFFNRCLENEDHVVDDYMIKYLPILRQHVIGKINMPERSEEVKEVSHKYKLTSKFDFWEPDHHTEFERLKKDFGGKDGLRFVEIGALEGRTSVWLLDNVLTGKDCRLTCVDIDPHENLEYNLKSHSNKAHIAKSFSHEWFYDELYDGGELYDFIYLDGDHNATGLLEDIVLAWRAIKTGGYLYLDDYEMQIRDPWFYIMHSEFKDNPRLNFIHPHVAIDAFLNIYRGQYELLFKNYLVGVRKLVDIGGKNIGHGDSALATLGNSCFNKK